MGLRVCDIDCDTNSLLITRGVWKGIEGPTKGGKDRRVPMTDRLRLALDEMTTGVNEDAYVLTGGSKPMGRGSLKHHVRVAEGAAAGKPANKCKGRLHTLRHTFCSALVRRGVHPRVVQRLAGHSKLTQTERYMSVGDGQLHEAIVALSGNGAAANAPQADPPDEKTE